MFVGHLGVGLGLKKIDKRINLGWIFFASLFPDFLLGIFVLFGFENLIIPENYDQIHFLEFTFPYSHSMLAIFLWSGIVYLLAKMYWPKVNGQNTKAALIFSSAIFLHFITDFIVHIPDLPLISTDSLKIGLGLWNHMTIALVFEVLLVIVGLAIYLTSTESKGFASKYGIIILMLVLTIFNILGQTIAPAPANISGPAISFVVQPLIISGIAFWLDKKRG